jgi:hypothetical protein
MAGWTSVLAMLLLSSPGVRVVRADEPAPPAAPVAGPMCSADSSGSAVVSIALPSGEEVADRQREREQPTVVPLDGGGDGYGRAELPATPPRR